MPSSMIFAGLVVIWLLILVPAVARHRQEVARPSVAALSGRVLERPRRRQNLEVDVMDDVQKSRPVATRTDRADDTPRVPAARDGDDGYVADEYPDDGYAPDEYSAAGYTAAEYSADEYTGEGEYSEEPDPDDRRWERPPPRYRPGRGGFDPEAAALAAGARYAFRQRVVLAMLVVALVTGVLAAVAIPGLWWPHAAVDLVLVGYLVYLRRQVRMEESIRERRAARMAGTRRPSAAEDPELGDRAQRGRDEAVRDREPDDGPTVAPGGSAPADRPDEPARTDDVARTDDPDRPDDLDREQPDRVAGVGQPLREPETADGAPEPALPRLQPVPPPPLPPGTALVEIDDQDPELHELDAPSRPDYRRAAGE